MAVLGRYIPGIVILYVLGELRGHKVCSCVRTEQQGSWFKVRLGVWLYTPPSTVLAVFLWPLISSHDVSLWLKPVLQKLDFGVGEFLQRVKENHGDNRRHTRCMTAISQKSFFNPIIILYGLKIIIIMISHSVIMLFYIKIPQLV